MAQNWVFGANMAAFSGEKADFVAVSAVKVAVEGGLAVNTAIGLNGPGA